MRIVIWQQVINLDDSGSFEAAGPNYAPATIGLRDSCAAPIRADAAVNMALLVTDPNTGLSSLEQVSVKATAQSHLLDAFASWVGNHASTTPGAWHLLTDCLPPLASGGGAVVGVAFLGAACNKGSTQAYVVDTGSPCATGEDCSYRLASNDNRLAVQYPVAGSACADMTSPCVANAGLSSYTTDTWRTFAHESRRTAVSRDSFAREHAARWRADYCARERAACWRVVPEHAGHLGLRPSTAAGRAHC
jgi:hypothetical protein